MDKSLNNFFSGKKILITGHTGFKGSWLSMVLHIMGAKVFGYSLNPPTNPSLFEVAGVGELVTSYIGDIRDFNFLKKTISETAPEIIIHMAAQPLVLEAFKNPVETYSVNVMGTVNLLEAVRLCGGVKAIVNVTTDKCYENKEWLWGYRENETLGGYDPYSNSKACSELATSSYRNSFFNKADYQKHGVAIATARAGNVIGGGDWAADRLIPDFIRAISVGEKVKIRNPLAIRPWQHVLEPLFGYLVLAENLYTVGTDFGEAWNFGPDDTDARNVEWVIKKICSFWGETAGYETDKNNYPHEAGYLKLDCSKAKTKLGWSPKWNLETSLKSIVDWNKAYLMGDNMKNFSFGEIEKYFDTNF
jgi:CDP-glucose 4,6-dehydratase